MTFDRGRLLQHSLMAVEFLDGDGQVRAIRRMETTVRYICQAETELLLRLAGSSGF